MNILAVDTTTKKAQVAIKKGNDIFIKEIDNEITHSEKLLPLIDEVLKDASLTLKDIDLYSCVLGPGSFTGVRIAIATIKALAKVTNKEIFGITSLKLLALNETSKIKDNSYVLSLIDAKHDRAYYELFKYKDGILKEQDYYGNDLIKNIQQDLSSINEKELTIITDNPTSIDESFPKDTYNIVCSLLNIKNALEFEEPNYTYLTLDAVYYRKSEAERTKFGE